MALEEREISVKLKKTKGFLGDKSKKLLKMTVSSSSYDFRQSMLALLMVLFFVGYPQKEAPHTLRWSLVYLYRECLWKP